MSPSSRGSGTGRSASTDQNSATSSTLRPIGPIVSNDGQSGKTPVVGTSPSLVFSPTVSHAADGRRIEQPVSEPIPRSQRPAASAAALPLDEPPVVLPDGSGCGRCRTTGSRRARSRRTPAGVPCRSRLRRPRRPGRRRRRFAPARDLHTGPIRTSCGCRRCRSDP